MNTLLLAIAAFVVQNATIQGVVVKDGSDEPLAKATVELRVGADISSVLDSSTTEDDGRFAFRALKPGQYQVSVIRSGYTRAPVTVQLGGGTPQQVLRLPMKATGVIYGRVTDGKGEPLGNIEVQALKASYPDGRRVFTAVRSAQTNDAGEYRLFWLPPGRYYVAAIHPNTLDPITRAFRSGAFGMSTIGVFSSTATGDPAITVPLLLDIRKQPADADRYMPVFFPGTMDEESAAAITVASGREVGGVNVAVTPVRARHVRGVIVDGATGRPAEYGSLTLNELPERLSNGDPAVDPNSATFDIVLLPGAHELTANARSGEGRVIIHVGDIDVENLTIPTTPPFSVHGRISIEGRPINGSELDELRISLRRDPPSPSRQRPGQASYSIALEGGLFNLEGMAGDFRVAVAPVLNLGFPGFPIKLPASLQNAYVKSIRLGNTDVLNNGLHLEKQPEGLLEIVLGTNPGKIGGLVFNDAGQPAGDVSVLLEPDNHQRTDLYFSTTTDPSGRFRFERIPPGDYKVFAWTEIENGSWYDAGFMREYESRGTAMQIQEGAQREVQIRVIP